MLMRLRQPAPPLDRFIDRLWYMSGSTPVHSRERALPTATLEIVINLADSRMRLYRDDADLAGESFREAVICGPQLGYFVLDTADTNAVVGVHFRPGGAAPFVGSPLGELTDRHVELGDLWGPFARSLRERLLQARSVDDLFDLLEYALRLRYTERLLPHPAAEFALTRLDDASRIRTVQTRTGYSPKRFIETFRDAAGLTPKRYCRIRRFQSVLARLISGQRVEWADVAAASGYVDQPHLTREFREFAGVTPAAYRPVSDDRPSHVAVG
jgi:AraC-like DNA-binding protein